MEISGKSRRGWPYSFGSVCWSKWGLLDRSVISSEWSLVAPLAWEPSWSCLSSVSSHSPTLSHRSTKYSNWTGRFPLQSLQMMFLSTGDTGSPMWSHGKIPSDSHWVNSQETSSSTASRTGLSSSLPSSSTSFFSSTSLLRSCLILTQRLHHSLLLTVTRRRLPRFKRCKTLSLVTSIDSMKTRSSLMPMNWSWLPIFSPRRLNKTIRLRRLKALSKNLLRSKSYHKPTLRSLTCSFKSSVPS